MRVVGDWFRVTWLREAQLCTLNINKKENSELGYISNEDFVFVEQRIERVAKLLSGLRKV